VSFLRNSLVFALLCMLVGSPLVAGRGGRGGGGRHGGFGHGSRPLGGGGFRGGYHRSYRPHYRPIRHYRPTTYLTFGAIVPFGSVYYSPWDCDYDPAFGFWYFRGSHCWYTPRFNCWVYWQKPMPSRRPVLVIESDQDTLWFAVYRNKGKMLVQAEAPRTLTRAANRHLFTDRSPQDIIVIADTEDDLPRELNPKTANKRIRIIENNVINNHQTVKKAAFEKARSNAKRETLLDLETKAQKDKAD